MKRYTRILKAILPPVLVSLCRRRGSDESPYGFTGSFPTWAAAQNASRGYAAPEILESMLAAALRVKRGQAACERDTVCLPDIEYSWPLMAGLMWAAAQSAGELRVLDFGGALGTTYFQSRRFLAGLRHLSWGVVEQPHVVQAGREQLADGTLRFYPDIDACCREIHPNVVVFASVLQYLEHPYAVLEQCFARQVPFLLIDRTPFADSAADRICVQRVPPVIYNGSYPAWVFSRSRFTDCLAHREVVAEFDSTIGNPMPGCVLKGFIVRTGETPIPAREAAL